jgi:hypothetical protein
LAETLKSQRPSIFTIEASAELTFENLCHCRPPQNTTHTAIPANALVCTSVLFGLAARDMFGKIVSYTHTHAQTHTHTHTHTHSMTRVLYIKNHHKRTFQKSFTSWITEVSCALSCEFYRMCSLRVLNMFSINCSIECVLYRMCSL